MANGRAQIGFEQLGLGSVLKQYLLGVPPNQREYSWTEREVTTLFRDFAKAISDDEATYFLGTVVTIPRTTGILEVVDGQQRLATTAILLSAIRDHLIGRENIIVEAVNNEFLTGIDREQRARVPRLRLNVDDNDYFRAKITGTDEIAATRVSHERIGDAFEQARRHIARIVSGYDPRDHGDVLNRWIEFVEHGALVVLLKVSDDVNAYKMFETLNDRGLRTSQSDLVKNYLFGRSGDRLGETQQKWALMRGTLESLDDEDITVTFLRHALISIRGYLREAEVYEAVQAEAKGAQSAIAFVSKLEMLAINYVASFNPEHEKWNAYPDATRRAIEALNLFNIKPMRPLILAIATIFDEKETARALQLLISWSVRLLIAASTRSGSVEVPLASAAHEIFEGLIADTVTLKKRMGDVMPGDDQFRQAFESASVSASKFARYYLRSLELAAKEESEPWFIPNDDRHAINLEHVLPLKPEGNWPEFDEEQVRIYAKRVGNMALLRAKSNSDLRSAEFSTKKAEYANSPYILTSQIASLASWGPAEIIARQKVLAALAVRAWPL